MNTNNQIIKSAGITTADVTSGLLNPEQSKQFIKQVFEATALGGLIRHEMRRAKTGEIDKIGIASRILRKKTEDVDAKSDGTASAPGTGGYRAKPKFSQVDYATIAVRLPWEITEETLRENIEGEGLEGTITNLMTTQLGIDLEDLYLNSDTATASDHPDFDFLKLNDGWIKQILAGGHVYDASTVSGGAMSLDLFYKALMSLPNKYNNGKLRWLMSPHRAQEWELFLLNKVVTQGGAVPDSLYDSPAKIPVVSCPSMPDDIIILTDPRNLVVVNTYDIKIRKTVEGKDAIMQDKRFYACHLDFDAIIEELDATAIIKGLA